MKNADLKEKYNKMHEQGASAWYSDGAEERATILNMGPPWKGRYVLEIGCGEGDLANLMAKEGAEVYACDYSGEAIRKAKKKYPNIRFQVMDFHEYPRRYDRVVMQGVLEHLDEPWNELEWIAANLLVSGGDIITSSPCFTNARGIVWMTLDMLGAVMSKTDLHFLHPWEFRLFCEKHECRLTTKSCDYDWANGREMIVDLKQRIPLALKDGGIQYNNEKLGDFMRWLNDLVSRYVPDRFGATMVYRIAT